MRKDIRKLAKQTRFYRRFHKFIAVPMLFFMLLLGTTGLLLTWKAELKLQPPSLQSAFTNQSLVSLSIIEKNAIRYADSLQLSSTINRIDYRPAKGIAKIRFENHFTELQIDCYTGKIISVKQRPDTVIEMIHDGSIMDYLFKSKSENVKLFYSTITSFGLILLAFSGFWLWLKPKQIKKHKIKKH
ncbi:MAG: PepSY domain-containing protein [Bacteroidetes bacterium]|nr:MAG: PepSY domain-containing protein [Bacteroidota bacterium]